MTALAVYDHQGKAAIIAFLPQNQEPRPQQPGQADPWAREIFPLKDGSEVRLTYAVHSSANPQDTRPATLGIPQYPFPPAEPVPMFTQPNSESLSFEIIQLAHDPAEDDERNPPIRTGR